jgi:hypothetical protein
MRWIPIAIVLALAGCGDGGPAPADAPITSPYACGEPPPGCLGRLCILEQETVGLDDCCDSMFCNCKPSTLEWEVVFCEPEQIDAAADASPLDASPGGP